MRDADAIVVGAGPNGLVAALMLARAGLAVDVYEAADEPGGGCRTAELTLPGFHHDICSAVHPLLLASPAFRDIDLSARGVRLLTPPVAFAHPLGGARAVSVGPEVDDVARSLGSDGHAYARLFAPLVRDLDKVLPAFLGSMRDVPRHPLAAAGFALRGLPSAQHLARRFRTEEGRALVAGTAAHSMLPLTAPLSGVFPRLFTALAHRYGWPVVEGGSAAVVDALVAELTAAGGRVETGCLVKRLDQLPPARAVVLDVTPRQLIEMAGDSLPAGYRPRVGPLPLRARGVQGRLGLGRAGPLERPALPAGRHPPRGRDVRGDRPQRGGRQRRPAPGPPVLPRHPAVRGRPGRAPENRHTLWAYCHVPNGSSLDMTERIEAQIERFAPGFRDLILGRSTFTAMAAEEHNPSYVGGDINAGAATLRQMVLRPTARWNPYRTAIKGVYLCSAATPPGGGVHGMCGLGAARAALHDLGHVGANAA